MNWKTWIPLVLAIVLGVVAAKLMRDMLMKNKPVEQQVVKLAKLVVAKNDLMPGHEIVAGDLTEGQVGLDVVPADSFKDPALVVGRSPEIQIVKGQAIVENMLTPTGSGSGLASLVQPGMRAITMEVNEFSGVAGLLQPGCRVDVIATLQGDGKQVARTIVQNVKVTAVGQRLVNPPATEAGQNGQPAQQQQQEITRSVTVLASLKEAEAIELAASTGRPRLVLRSSRDKDVKESEGITIGELKGGEKKGFWDMAIAFMNNLPRQPVTMVNGVPTTQPIAKAEPQKKSIKVYRQGVESVVQIELPNKDGKAITDTKELLQPAVGQ